MKKINFETIKKIDYILVFLAGIIAAIFLLVFLVSEIVDSIPRRHNPPNIQIVDKDDPAAKDVEFEELVDFYEKLKDVYVFSVKTRAIKADELESDESMLKGAFANSLQYSANDDGLINFIFVKDGKESKLFSFKGYIYKSCLATKDKCDFNIYAVIKEDSDSDKKLTSKDRISLYVSDYDGTKLEEVSPEIYNFCFVEKNMFIFTERQDNILSFYEYDGNSRTKKFIKKVEQKEGEKSIEMTKYAPILIRPDYEL